MTVISKNNFTAVKKMEIIKVPLGDDNIMNDEDRVEVHPPPQWPSTTSRTFVCLSFTSMLLVLALTTGLLTYRQFYRAPIHRYQGFCSVPLPIDVREDSQLIEPNFRVLPLRWTPDPDVQFVSTLDDGPTDDLLSALREELDIQENIEKIGVVDNGRRVNFIHDFVENITGIVDTTRCFVLEMTPELVLDPIVFAAQLSRGDKFDVSRVRSALRAVLPALNDPPTDSLSAACSMRPTYRLQRDEAVFIRKRSTDDLPHDYIHFSGKHVQEIKINNMQEILDYESHSLQV